MYYQRKLEAFAVFTVYQCCGFTLNFAYGNYFCVRTKVLIMLAFLILGIIQYSYLHLKHRKKMKKAQEKQEEELKEIKQENGIENAALEKEV